MKLSEAIRLGAMSTKQLHGILLEVNNEGAPIGACALGAAGVAVGKNGYDLAHTFPLLLTSARHPALRGHKQPVDGIIVNLNDKYLWTREAIADWVETVEAQYEAERGDSTRVDEHETDQVRAVSI